MARDFTSRIRLPVDWQCESAECGMVVQQVSGGRNRGLVALTQTRTCIACGHVRDYGIGVVSDPALRIFTEDEIQRLADPEPACIKCGHKTVPWRLQCPKCGSTMYPGEVPC